MGLKRILSEVNSYSKTEVDAKITAVVDSAPEALDTLKELSQALGDDANFATTVLDAIAGKETPTAAQEKADAAVTAANAYTDEAIAAVSVGRSVTVSETVAVGDILYLTDDGEYALASNTSIDTCGFIAVALSAGTGTQTVLETAGIVSGYTGLTVGGAVYLGTAGQVTQTAPTETGTIVKCVGVAIAADSIRFEPDIIAVEN